MIFGSEDLCQSYETYFDIIEPVLNVQEKQKKKCLLGLKCLIKKIARSLVK